MKKREIPSVRFRRSRYLSDVLQKDKNLLLDSQAQKQSLGSQGSAERDTPAMLCTNILTISLIKLYDRWQTVETGQVFQRFVSSMLACHSGHKKLRLTPDISLLGREEKHHTRQDDMKKKTH